MTNRALWKKAINDVRLLWLSCAALLYSFCWVRVWITSQVDMSQFKGILDNLPESWQRLSPVPIDQLITYPARIAMTYDEPAVYLAIAVWALARSSDCVAGEIGRGTMEMLLAQPVRRLHVLLIPTLVTIAGAALLAVVAWSGTWTGIETITVPMRPPEATWTVPLIGIEIPLASGEQAVQRVPMSELVNAQVFLPAALNLFSLGFFLAGVGTFLSSWDRYRWRTIGILVAVYVMQMIVELIGMAVRDLEWLRHLTFFSAYDPVGIVSWSISDPTYAWSWIHTDDLGTWIGLGPLGLDGILIGLGMIGYVLGGYIFSRRDLPAPL